jgi:DNA-directed RNA polymerase subunit F
MDEVLKEKLITSADALEILKIRSKEIELGYEQKNALDHLKKYCGLNEKKAQELIQKLLELTKLTERQIISIVDILPKDRDDLRVILEKDYKNLTEEEKTLILDNVGKLAK